MATPLKLAIYLFEGTVPNHLLRFVEFYKKRRNILLEVFGEEKLSSKFESESC
jgi:hypothetical protein